MKAIAVVEENARILENDPLSATACTRFDSTLARGAWKVRAVTSTPVWSERLPPDQVVFRYEALVETFVNDQPFEEKSVDGVIRPAGADRAFGIAPAGTVPSADGWRAGRLISPDRPRG